MMVLRTSSEAELPVGVAVEAAQMALDAGLVYVSSTESRIRRHRVGKGFYYLNSDNRRITAAAELKRIAALAVPPAYENVWICPHTLGHLQATGRDARGRKQYRYHPRWRELRDTAKFHRMSAFADALPRLRRKPKRDLELAGLPREKVLAAVVALLDATRARVGNVDDSRENKTFGLTPRPKRQ